MASPQPTRNTWTLLAILAVVALAFTLLNYDPLGDFLVRQFGKGGDRMALNLVFLVLIIWAFRKKK